MARRLSQRRTARAGHGLQAQRLLALAVLGLMLFDFPVLTLWVDEPMALFVVWGLFVAGLAWLLEAGSSGDPAGGPGEAASPPLPGGASRTRGTPGPGQG